MINCSSSNVIPFGKHESVATPEISVDHNPLLTACRDRLIQGITTIFAQNVEKAKEEFLTLADRARNMEQQQTCFAAMSLLANRLQQLLQNFRVAYLNYFDAGLINLNSPQHSQTKNNLDELGLVNPDDFEQDLAIGKLAARAVLNCSQQMIALDRRLAVILRLKKISQDENLFHPALIFKAMLQALTEMDGERLVSLTILQTFERHTANGLPGLYADLNQFLSQSGILSNIPLNNPNQSADELTPAPVNSNPPLNINSAATGAGWGVHDQPEVAREFPGKIITGATRTISAPAAQNLAAGSSGDTAANNNFAGPNVFAQLLQALQTLNVAPSNNNINAQPTVNSQALPILTDPAIADFHSAQVHPQLAANQLVAALGDLQHGRIDPKMLPTLGANQLDPAQNNVLQQIRATPLATWSNPTDALTIDIVAMLFDAIFNDPELSANVRAELAKLQIPILKVALLDKAFFADRKHPARKLLDAIANSGVGRGAQDEPRLLSKINEIVTAIINGFEADLQVFTTQTEELEEFLRAEEQQAQRKTEPIVDQLALQERKASVAHRVRTELEQRVNQTSVAALIKDFLIQTWRVVLADAWVRGGEASASWSEALQLMDELIWSTIPKSNAVDRDRLISLLPKLLKQLRARLDLVQLNNTWDKFFNDLIQLHMNALRGSELSGSNPPPAIKPVTAYTPSNESNAAMIKSEPPVHIIKQIPSVVNPAFTQQRVASSSSSTAENNSTQDRYVQLVQALQVGAWIEFQHFSGTRNTLRLNWVSELRRVFLFTNRKGENAITLAATSLADHLRKGSARLLSADPLIDRAVSQVLKTAELSATN